MVAQIGRRGYARLGLAELFIASLALINIRFAGISPPLVAGALLVMWELPRVISRGSNLFHALDAVVLAYVLLAVVTFTPEHGPLAIIKSVAYYASFVALRSSLADAPDLGKALLRGVLWGSVLFTLTIVVAFATGNLQLADLASFSYDTITVKMYRQFAETNLSNSFEGRDVLRNSIAEVHSLYYVIAYNFGKLLLCGVPVLGIFLFQSRRAFLVAVSATLFSGGIDWRKAVVVFITAIVIAGYVYYADYFSISTRFAEFGSEGRTSQYSEAWFWIRQSPLVGYGYGEQVQDKYVHNFFLGSWFMMGLAGLALSLLFVAAVAPLALGTGPHRWLLFIPLFDVSTGANVEGILTFSSWTALAILSVMKYDHRLVRLDSASMPQPARMQPA